MTAEVIYLIPGEGEYHESYLWCEDPAPGSDDKEEYAIKYIRADKLLALEKKLLHLIRDAKECCHEEMQVELYDRIQNLGL